MRARDTDSGIGTKYRVRAFAGNEGRGTRAGGARRSSERPIEAVGDGYTTGLRGRIETASEGLGLKLQFAGDGRDGRVRGG